MLIFVPFYIFLHFQVFTSNMLIHAFFSLIVWDLWLRINTPAFSCHSVGRLEKLGSCHINHCSPQTFLCISWNTEVDRWRTLPCSNGRLTFVCSPGNVQMVDWHLYVVLATLMQQRNPLSKTKNVGGRPPQNAGVGACIINTQLLWREINPNNFWQKPILVQILSITFLILLFIILFYSFFAEFYNFVCWSTWPLA